TRRGCACAAPLKVQLRDFQRAARLFAAQSGRHATLPQSPEARRRRMKFPAPLLIPYREFKVALIIGSGRAALALDGRGRPSPHELFGHSIRNSRTSPSLVECAARRAPHGESECWFGRRRTEA